MHNNLANKIIKKAGSITLRASEIREENISGGNGKPVKYNELRERFKAIENICDDIKLEIIEYFKLKR